MTDILFTKREDLSEALRAIMEAVKQGELDIQIGDVVELGTAKQRMRAPLKPVKKAS